MRDTELIVSGRSLDVRWLTVDGQYQAKEFLQQRPKEFKQFLAQVRELAETGHVRNPERAHLLKGAYRDIFEFKPSAVRVFGFRRGHDFFVVSAAPKKSVKQQNHDYQRALDVYNDYLQELAQQADGPHRT